VATEGAFTRQLKPLLPKSAQSVMMCWLIVFPKPLNKTETEMETECLLLRW
jgi:hypothetical protein